MKRNKRQKRPQQPVKASAAPIGAADRPEPSATFSEALRGLSEKVGKRLDAIEKRIEGREGVS